MNTESITQTLNDTVLAKNVLTELRIITERDTDVSDLGDVDNDYNNMHIADEARLADYGKGWYYVGLYVQCIVAVPVGKSTQRIPVQSGGLWGIESDMGIGYFEETAEDEAEGLRAVLIALNVDVSNLDTLFAEAKQNITIA